MNDDSNGETTPQDGEIGDVNSPGESSGGATPLGSAIGSQFEPPTEPLLPVPPPPTPAPPTPPAPQGAQSWGTSTPAADPAPPANVPWGSTVGTNPAAGTPNPPPAAGYTTPSEPAHYPVAEPVFGSDSTGGSSKLPWVFAVVAAVVLLGGGAFFAVSALGASGGASSPDEGIEAVLGAVGDEDFVTLAELMEPSERRTLAEPAITELLPELVRLGVLDDSVDAGDVEGVDLVFTDVEYRVERLVGVDDIAHVFLTGGEIATNIDAAALPFTSDVDTADLDQQDRQEITESETPIVFVERDGDWFFSLWFTLAENARLAADEPLPTIDESPARIPSDSPEAAIEAMFASLTSFDLEAMVGHMDPEEMAVLYRYSPIFLEDAQAELNNLQGDLRDEGIIWEMTDFDFDVNQDGDDAVVTMRGFTVDFVGEGLELSATYSRDELTGELDVDGVAVSLTATTTDYALEGQLDGSLFEAAVSIEPESNRISGTVGIEGDSFDGELVLDATGECSRFEISGTDGTNESGCLEQEAGIDGLGPILEAMEDWPAEFPGFSMRTRQVDGGWYVSPIGTVFDGVVTSLEGLEEGDFDDVFDPFAAVDPFSILDDGVDFIDPGGATPDLFDDDTFPDDDTFDEDVFEDDVFESFADPELEDESSIVVAAGESVEFSGEISGNGFDTYLVELDAGSRLLVSAQAANSNLDTTLRIVDPAGSQVASNDDADEDAGLPSSLDSLVIFTAQDTGVYVLEVAGFSGSSVGEYLLTVDRFLDEDAVADADISVASGDTLVVDGEVISPAEFSIELDAGDNLVITVESNSDTLDPVVSLLFDGNQIGRNDDADDSSAVADSFDSQLLTAVAETGTHTILVEGFAGTSGNFVMTVERN